MSSPMTSGTFINFDVFTPQNFRGMPPHMQSEALRLAVEFGMKLDVVSASIDLPVQAAHAILQAQHRHALSSQPAEPGDDDLPESIGQTNRMKIIRILRRMMDGDGIAWTSTSDIGDMIGMRPASVARAMRDLAISGHVVCLASGGPARSAQYKLTAAGLALSQGDRR